MRKATRKVEEEAVEVKDVSPVKKSKLLKEKKVIKEAPVSNRLPRAAKTRSAARITNNNVEDDVDTKKSSAKPRNRIRRSNSSGDVSSMVTVSLKKVKSKSVENLDQQEDVPPAKKTKNPPVKNARGTVSKKAGNEAKAKPRGKAAKEIDEKDVDKEQEDERPVLIAKKARATSKKIAPDETKEDDKSGKRTTAKKVAPVKQTARGRGKLATAEDGKEDVAEVKPARGRKGKTSEKKSAQMEENMIEVTTDEEDDDKNGNEEIYKDPEEEVAKPKKGGKKVAAPMTKSRGPKYVSESNLPVDVKVDDENFNESPSDDLNESKEEAKSMKIGKRGKAAAMKSRVKKGASNRKDDYLENQEAKDQVDDSADHQEILDEPEKIPDENDEFKMSGSDDEVNADDNDDDDDGGDQNL